MKTDVRMIHLFQEGIRQRDIAKTTGQPLCTANRILQAFRDEGRIVNLPRGRRPRATTSEQDMLIRGRRGSKAIPDV
ncbi:hypothetical protein HPB48_016484 [Haemaphysalis longicornis]|uniref:Paired domain-containing protein n=1 Tax=Haemaphysalis longicornis TaxID=44386 RepID=A0A9J6FX99_HAELO|nr:hypothetical protein HPB48_016484 [Haemaphysalis longicornis]